MPKKHKNTQYSKPASTAHPSLSSNNITGNDSNKSAVPSVNDVIQHLRQSHVASVADRYTHNDTNFPTVHPSLKAILQLPDTLPLRPRSNMYARGGIHARRPAGPPPPGSWLSDSIHAPRRFRDSHTQQHHQLQNLSLKRLPGLFLPKENSLLHLTLKLLAKNWRFHLHYDQYHLATLPGHLKGTLLAYIAVYHSDSGVTLEGIETLFLNNTQLQNATGSDDITHLDLSASVGTPDLTFRELHIYLTKHSPSAVGRGSALRSTLQSSSSAEIPESWDAPDPQSSATFLTSQPRFPRLTHLSLSHAREPSWRALLTLTPNLTALTHLSLAYWSVPSLTPNSTTATITSPTGNVQRGTSQFHPASDGNFREAAGVLGRLAKVTLYLKWLDLEGCNEWVDALGYSEHAAQSQRPAARFNDFWRSLETIRVAQGTPVPECFHTPKRWEQVLRAGPNRDLLQAWLKAERKIAVAERAVMGFRRDAMGRRIFFDKDWNRAPSSLNDEIVAALVKTRDDPEYLTILGYSYTT